MSFTELSLVGLCPDHLQARVMSTLANRCGSVEHYTSVESVYRRLDGFDEAITDSDATLLRIIVTRTSRTKKIYSAKLRPDPPAQSPYVLSRRVMSSEISEGSDEHRFAQGLGYKRMFDQHVTGSIFRQGETEINVHKKSGQDGNPLHDGFIVVATYCIPDPPRDLAAEKSELLDLRRAMRDRGTADLTALKKSLKGLVDLERHDW